MSKQCKTTQSSPVAQLKYSPENLEVKAVFGIPEDKLKLVSVDAFINRKPGLAKADVLYIADDFDMPLKDFAD